MNREKIIAISIFSILISITLTSGCISSGDHDQGDLKTYFKCLSGKNQVETGYFESRPSGWSDSPMSCLTPCGFTKTSSQYDSYFPYIVDSKRGYLTQYEIEKKLRDHFKYDPDTGTWRDNPYHEPDHVCRHMAMEVERYLEEILDIDCLWGSSASPAHTWVYILVKSGIYGYSGSVSYKYKFEPFEAISLYFIPDNYVSPLDRLTHGNYIYGNLFNRRNGEPFIYGVSDWSEVLNVPCYKCQLYIPGTGMWHNPDVILSLSKFEMFLFYLQNLVS